MLSLPKRPSMKRSMWRSSRVGAVPSRSAKVTRFEGLDWYSTSKMSPALRPGVTSPVPANRKRVLLLSLSTWKLSLRRPSSTNMTLRLTWPESLTSMPCACTEAADAATAAAMKSRPLCTFLLRSG
jgi:hypothetical protein